MKQPPSNVLNIGYLIGISRRDPDRLDRVLRTIIDLSIEGPDDKWNTFAYSQVGPLHFDFLSVPLILRYNTGIFLLEKIEKPIFIASQGILIDFGNYLPHAKIADGDINNNFYLARLAWFFKKPTVHMVHGDEEQIEMGKIRSMNKLEEVDLLMVYDPLKPDSLKKILQKLVEKTLDGKKNAFE